MQGPARSHHSASTVLLAVGLALGVVAPGARADEEVQPVTLQPGDEGDAPEELTVVGDLAFFIADDESGERRLYVSDGTPDGTRRVGPDGTPADLARHGDELWFALDDGETGAEPWRTDGTDAGTEQVFDLRTGPDGSAPRDFTSVGDRVVFSATDGVRGRELWLTDGEELTCLSDPDAVAGSSAGGVFGAADGIVYYAGKGPNGELRGGISDLTVEGTSADVVFPGRIPLRGPACVSGPDLFISTRDQVDGRFSALQRVQPNGETTYLAPTALEVADVGGRMFTARQSPRSFGFPQPLPPTEGVELFALAEERDSIQRIVQRGEETSIASPGKLGPVRGRLYLALTTKDEGRELWITDATEAGTHLLCDFAEGPDDSGVEPFAIAGEVLYVAARTGTDADGPRSLHAVALADLALSRSLRDLDGDGFPGETESALGSDPDDIGSTPDDADRIADPLPLDVRRVKVRLRFDRADRDKLALDGRLPVAEGADPEGTTVTVNAGGVVRQFTLDRRGRATGADGSRFRLKVRRRRGVVRENPAAKFTLRISGAPLAGELGDEGLVGPIPPDVTPTPLRPLGVHIVLGSEAHAVRSPLDTRLRRKGRELRARLAR